MKVFYDFEFLEDGATIDPISVGLVDEKGRTYYAVNYDANWERIKKDDWLMENVWPHLPLFGRKTGGLTVGQNHPGSLDTSDVLVKPRWVIRNEVRAWLAEPDEKIELWADCGAYDHVALMQLCWGAMINKPKHMPYYTHDLMQRADSLGFSEGDLPAPDAALRPHHALDDATADRDLFGWLDAVRQEREQVQP